MEAGKRNISDIFNSNRVLEIPFFQRSYVWDKENWERFLDDMKRISDEKTDYFMGSLILKQKSTPSNSPVGDWRQVVDGQQRLTTLTIFFKELCHAQEMNEKFARLFTNREDEVVIKHNHNDVTVFEAILTNSLTKELAEQYSTNSILLCHQYFRSRHEELRHIDFNTLLNKIYFVGIDLGKEEDEQQIFDTINSLGVSLTTAELLKNELFKRDEEGFYDATWKKTFEGYERDYWSEEVTAGRVRRENIDLLLQSHLLFNSDAKEKYSRVDSLFRSYKARLSEVLPSNGADTDARKAFVNDLIATAKLYKSYIAPSILKEAIKKDSPTDRLNLVIFGTNTTTVVPYITYILRTVNDEHERNAMFSLLESYLMRRFIARETTKNYNNLFISFIRNKINSYASLHSKLTQSDNQTDILPDNEAVRKGVRENQFTNQQAKVILYLLELSLRDEKRDSTSILGFNSYTLEHVMPKKWKEKWRDNLDEARIIQRNKAILKLGNFTLITAALNTSISNSCWEEKKSGKGEKDGLKKHSQGIKIFDEEYLNRDAWDEACIAERGEFLADTAIKTWSIAPLDTLLISPLAEAV